MNPPFPFNNSYARLPARFFQRQQPEPVALPELFAFNDALANNLGLNPAEVSLEQKTDWFAGNQLPPGADPLAMAYAGHQFGHFVPQLGDGRALLLGEVLDARGRAFDIQLKGSGRTAFSRGGDGRAALGPVLREYLLSEAMHALGIPTTRALAAVTTGQPVQRDTLLPGAIVTRVARSHVRVGTFQYFAARQDVDAIRTLVQYTCRRLYPDVPEQANAALGLLQRVVEAQAGLVAQWLAVGFIHGVMNTDNCAVSGETIDYGPCAFLDEYDPAKVFSSIDRNGRYAYANQPNMAGWNLTRLAEALLPVISNSQDEAAEKANAVLENYPGYFRDQWLMRMRAKLGLADESCEDREDSALIQNLLDILHAESADFTVVFRALSHAAEDSAKLEQLPLLLDLSDDARFRAWVEDWQLRLQSEPDHAACAKQRMLNTNPAFIPRNHQVQRAIAAAEQQQDFSIFDQLQTVLSRPYDEQPEHAEYQNPPKPEQRVLETFCGT